MNNKIFLLIIALCSGLTLTACDSGGGQSSSQDGGGGGGDQGGGDQGGGDEGGGDEGGGDQGGGDQGGGDQGGGDQGGGDEGGGDEGGGDEGGGDEGGGDEGGGDEGGGDEGGGDEGGGDEGGGDPQVPPHLRPCSVGTFANAVNALKNRDASKATEAELISYAQCVLDLQIKNPLRKQAVSMIYKGLGDTYTWEPGGYSHYFSTTKSDTTFSLLGTNDPFFSLAMAGEQQGQRYILLAQNPLLRGDTDKNQIWMKNMVSWLTLQVSSNRSSYQLAGQSDNTLHVVIANMKGTPKNTGNNAHYDAFKKWLDMTYPETFTVNANGTCDDEQLFACLSAQPADILIVGDYDVSGVGYNRIKSGIEYAQQNKLPILVIPSDAKPTPLILGLYQQMHISAKENYNGTKRAVDFPVAELRPTSAEKGQSALFSSLGRGEFSSSVFDADNEKDRCLASVLNCKLPAFMAAFRNGADFWRTQLINLDMDNIDVLENPERYPLLASSVLLADKYRQKIDYPVSAEEGAPFLQGLFADWVVDYSRPDNLVQPDLGEYAVKSGQVVKGSMTSFTPKEPVSEQRTITVPFTKQVTTSGWYAPPGKAVTISSSKESAAVVIQLGFGYTDVYYSAGNRKLVAPSEASLKDMPRITLAPGESRTFSTPYGGPMFIHFVDDTLTQATLNADGVALYGSITDINDTANIATFEQEIENGDTPWVDVKLDGIEVHALKFRFTEGLKEKSNVEAGITNTVTMLGALNNFYTWNHTLAGLKVVGKTLAQSLPADELKVCIQFWGEADCTDEKLHTRQFIQHINYDQRSRCVGGSGCSGNPFDTSWLISPYGWGESHEQGHNLQRTQLESNYVNAADKEDWSKYSKRSGESSNNIFPYYVLWKSTYGQNREGPFSNVRGDPRDVYAVMMSDLRGLKDGDGNPVIYDAKCRANLVEGVVASRYTAPWLSDKGQNYRESFYFQMAFQADKQMMRGGTTLDNGFNIYTLLYQHARIFAKYAGNASEWNAHRDGLGFSNFAWNGDATYGGKSVKDMPGNDFLLVSLSYITNADWRPYFDMYGLHYTELASNQVEDNGFGRQIEQKIFTNKHNSQNLPGKDITGDADFVTIDMTNKDSEFPGNPWNCN
ncbi:ImpA family metalloprotease [Ewingella americana]|uniref:ImpA family metalloprotease n=1 Tax=Ewingella americana TaxID=41202 RepID=UPI0012AD364F|nr:ImpA family metalloprotease [Ewingella americana]MRT05940.1 hypothetical protein [Ewingella americana]